MKKIIVALSLISVVVVGMYFVKPDIFNDLVNKSKIALMGTSSNPVQEKKKIIVNTFDIDPKIKDKQEYNIDSRVKNMYAEVASLMIKRDKDIRQRLMFIDDKDSDTIRKEMELLGPIYEEERSKIEEYCKNGSTHCLITVRLTGSSVEGSDVKVKLEYKLDETSQAFFNQVKYVDKQADKWYSAQLVSVNEKRFYPQLGKFQERTQETILKDDKNTRVNIDHILEGNSNHWNVQF